MLLCGTVLSGTVAAEDLCNVDYVIQHSWSTGAVHRVELQYSGPAIDGWELSWVFPGEERIDSIFNVDHTQDGASVTVSSLGWNSALKDGASRKFGFNVRNPGGDVPAEFFLNGQPCDGQTDDMAPDDPPGEPTDPGTDPGTPGDPMADATWLLDNGDSFLNFVSTKNQHTAESHRFTQLSGEVSEDGMARVVISLASVDTGIDIRNQRMQDLLFQTGQNPEAVTTMDLNDTLPELLALTPGQSMRADMPLELEVNGQVEALMADVRVQRITGSRYLVASNQPMLITADQFGLSEGVEALREIAGLNTISLAVPVDFALFFEADQLPTQ